MNIRTSLKVGFFTLLIAMLAIGSAALAKERRGSIEELVPIENRGDDRTEETKRARRMGEKIGRIGGVAAAFGIGKASPEAGLFAGQLAINQGDAIGGAIAERAVGPGPAARYMVKVRVDDGSVLAITQPRERLEGLGIGSRVVVEGTGDDAWLSAE